MLAGTRRWVSASQGIFAGSGWSAFGPLRPFYFVPNSADRGFRTRAIAQCLTRSVRRQLHSATVSGPHAICALEHPAPDAPPCPSPAYGAAAAYARRGPRWPADASGRTPAIPSGRISRPESRPGSGHTIFTSTLGMNRLVARCFSRFISVAAAESWMIISPERNTSLAAPCTTLVAEDMTMKLRLISSCASDRQRYVAPRSPPPTVSSWRQTPCPPPG